MSLYIGSQQVLVRLGGKLYELNIGTPLKAVEETNQIRLLSSDNYVLKDKNGVYLIPLPEDNNSSIMEELLDDYM